MKKERQVKLIFNREEHSHRESMETLLKGATRFDCMVAFAKMSGFDLLMKSLTSCLKKGLAARFAIGLDFFQTDPSILRNILKLSEKYDVSLYMSDSEWTFHPKLYALSGPGGTEVLVGSANLTYGGMERNYEASALISDLSGAMVQGVIEYIDELIEHRELKEASKERIDEYDRDHRIYHAFQKLADVRFKRFKGTVGANLEVLQSILSEMKRDQSDQGFDAQKQLRQRCLPEARAKIIELASGKLNSRAFLKQYELLLGVLHSGGLHRGKNRIAQNAVRFQAALDTVVQLNNASPEAAFQVLIDQFKEIPRAGINILTEILFAMDSQRFAVMNQNAVSGLRLANIDEFPARPNKNNVNAELYARYCLVGTKVRDQLGLKNFAELDALFNYAYWRDDDDHDE